MSKRLKRISTASSIKSKATKPDGWWHSMITVVIAVMLFITVYFIYGLKPAAYVALGCLFNLVMGPDLDQGSITYNEKMVGYIPVLGPLAQKVWIVIWAPYAVLIPHRSPLSHFPILGTIIRLSYLLFAICCIISITFVIPLNASFYVISSKLFEEYLLFSVFGLILADFGHWLRDTLG